MANRRMFSKSITGSDAFMDMPTSSRELYFQLGLYADDDGFVNPRGIMRNCGASEDDLKVLISKRFVLQFENGVLVIKHWKINNYIRKDFYSPTSYSDQKSLLYEKENGAYTLDKTQGIALCPHNVNNSLTQVRLGKGIKSTSSDVEIDVKKGISFEFFWGLYPKKVEKKKAEQKWHNLDTKIQETILADLPKRKLGEKWNKEKGRFVENPMTYLNGERWNDIIEKRRENNKTNASISQEIKL